MHLLITADTVGGVWTYTRELVCGLVARGHRVTLVSFGRQPNPSQTVWLDRKRVHFYPTDFPLEWMQDAKTGIIESVKFLEAIIQQSRPDILHFNQYCYGALECGIPKVVVAHSDVVSWWHAVHGDAPPHSEWLDWYTTLVSRGLRCADAVVAPSRWMLATLYRHYRQEFPSCVIYNGRNAELFHPSDRKTDCVLSVGRVWDEAKQIRLLLERKHKVPVRIAGAVEHPEKICSDASALAPDEALELCGEQDEAQMCALYSDAATYAATSRYEPFGLAPVEAALSGCALIANDIPVFHELWDDAAYYFKKDNPDSLAAAIATLAGDSQLRRNLAHEAQKRARARFNSQRMVGEYEYLYQRLLSGECRA